jgi:CDP-diacylglycerol--serine O-phosphatidyltransferase
VPNYRGVFPGIFTTGNLVCGFLGLLSAFEGDPITACWFVLLAGFLDALDGKVARLSGGSSQFGVELDSLADFSSFGVTPAMLVYSIKLGSLGRWGWVISIVYMIAAGYRLARYNLMADSEEKKNFVGLPVPAAALALVSFVILSDYLWGELRYANILVGMVVVTSFLMVSQVEYDPPPDRLVGPYLWVKAVVVTVATAALLVYPRLLLFPYIALYILFGLVREAYRMFSHGVGRVTGRYNHGPHDI